MTNQPETAAPLAAIARVRALHRKASHGETCVYCAHGQRLGYDTTWPCDTIRALDGTAEPAAVSAAVAPPTQAALHQRIAEALLDHLSRTADIRTSSSDGEQAFMPEVTDAERMRMADAVLAVLPEPTDRAAIYAEVAERLATDAEQGDKDGLTRIYRRSAAKQVREWADRLRRMADETATETPEDPARIDRLRPEFTEHASVEAIDAQLDRARRQERRWHIRAEWLIGLRQARTEQPAAGARQDGDES